MRKFLLLGASALMLAACQPSDGPVKAAPAISAEQIATNNTAINDWFEKGFNEDIMRSPMAQTYMGIKTEDYGKWD
ncbi:MAG: DUF885 domain-containing protein, partial [Robiginitomaculum sp.]